MAAPGPHDVIAFTRGRPSRDRGRNPPYRPWPRRGCRYRRSGACELAAGGRLLRRGGFAPGLPLMPSRRIPTAMKPRSATNSELRQGQSAAASWGLPAPRTCLASGGPQHCATGLDQIGWVTSCGGAAPMQVGAAAFMPAMGPARRDKETFPFHGFSQTTVCPDEPSPPHL